MKSSTVRKATKLKPDAGAVGEPGTLDAGAQAVDQPQPLAPGRQLLARPLEAHLGRPGPAQQAVAEVARRAAEPGPGRHEHEQVLRRAGQVRLARDPQRVGSSPPRLVGVADAGEPDRQSARLARDQAGDAQREFLVGRKCRQGLAEGLRPAAGAATRRAPACRPPRAAARPRRRARRRARASGRRIAAHQREQQRREAVGEVLELAVEQLRQLGDEAAVGGMERLDADAAGAEPQRLLAWRELQACRVTAIIFLGATLLDAPAQPLLR